MSDYADELLRAGIASLEETFAAIQAEASKEMLDILNACSGPEDVDQEPVRPRLDSNQGPAD